MSLGRTTFNKNIKMGAFAFDAVFFVLIFSVFTNILFTAYGDFKYLSDVHSIICVSLFVAFIFNRKHYHRAWSANILWTVVLAACLVTSALLLMLLLLPNQKNMGSYGAGLVLISSMIAVFCVGLEYNKIKVKSDGLNQVKYAFTLFLPIVVFSFVLGLGSYNLQKLINNQKPNRVMFTAVFDDDMPANPYWVERGGEIWIGTPENFQWQNILENSIDFDGSKQSENILTLFGGKAVIPTINSGQYKYTVSPVNAFLDGSGLYEFKPSKSKSQKHHAYKEYLVRDFFDDEKRNRYHTTFPKNKFDIVADGSHEAYESLNDGAMDSFPKTLAIGQKWREEGLSEGEIIIKAMNYLSENFTYHYDYLNYFPNVDEFVFDGEGRGVCTHFATIFTILLRGAGIPTRVITGYRGGERSGKTYTVRGRDAHMWVEVWRGENRGWVRMEPTDVVPVEKGIPQGTGFMDWLSGYNIGGNRARRDVSDDIPKSKMENNGLSFGGIALGFGVFFVLIYFLWLGVKYSKNKKHQIEREWVKIIKSINKDGEIKSWMGPGTVYLCTVNKFKDHDKWRDICIRYEKWKYDNVKDDGLYNDLKMIRRDLKK